MRGRYCLPIYKQNTLCKIDYLDHYRQFVGSAYRMCVCVTAKVDIYKCRDQKSMLNIFGNHIWYIMQQVMKIKAIF